MGLFKRLALALGWLKREASIIVVGLDNSGKSTLIRYLKPSSSGGGAALDIVPTVGFAQESFTKGKLRFRVWDMSGAAQYRPLWETFYADAAAVIFVVDAADALRLCVAADELRTLLEHPEMAAKAGGGSASLAAKAGSKGVTVTTTTTASVSASSSGGSSSGSLSSSSSSSPARPPSTSSSLTSHGCGLPLLVFANKHDLPAALDASDVAGQLGLHSLPPGVAWHIASSNALSGKGVEEGVAWLAEQLAKKG